MASSRRPSNMITSCVFHNSKEDGVWKPLSFHVNDWVTMLPSCKGAHRVKRTKRGEVKNHWKGRIIGFKVVEQGWLAKVQHVYSPKDLVLDSTQNISVHSYCKYFKQNVHNLLLKKVCFIYFILDIQIFSHQLLWNGNPWRA